MEYSIIKKIKRIRPGAFFAGTMTVMYLFFSAMAATGHDTYFEYVKACGDQFITYMKITFWPWLMHIYLKNRKSENANTKTDPSITTTEDN